MKITRIGVDLAKSVFEIAVSDAQRPGPGAASTPPGSDASVLAQYRPAEVLMEACGSAHHWGRELQAMGHSLMRSKRRLRLLG